MTNKLKNWEIVKAHEEGEEIELRPIKGQNWLTVSGKVNYFDFESLEYRLKPKKPETDWSKVPRDTPVLCWDYDYEECPKNKRHFDGYRDGRLYAFKDGSTSYTNEDEEPEEYDHMELDKSAPSIINWIENDGVAPDCKNALIKTIDGRYLAGHTEGFNFDKDLLSVIESYLIIE